MKSLKDFKCGRIIPNVKKKEGKIFPIFGEITIKASPSIYDQALQSSFVSRLEIINENVFRKTGRRTRSLGVNKRQWNKFFLNPACGRQSISQPMRIVSPMPQEGGPRIPQNPIKNGKNHSKRKNSKTSRNMPKIAICPLTRGL